MRLTDHASWIARKDSAVVRWSIRVQLLCSVLAMALLSIVLASGATAYWAAARARHQQEEDLRRVVRVLAGAWYPLTGSVLSQVSELAGAEFVIVGPSGHVRESTMELRDDDSQRLRVRASDLLPGDGRQEGSMLLAGQLYRFHRVELANRRVASATESLYVLYPEDRWSAGIQQATYPALISGLIAGLVAIVTTTFLAHRFVRPIRALVDRTGAIAAGDFTPARVSRHNNELRDLETSINSMVERLSKYEGEIRRAEQLRTIGRMGAGMAHQLRNAATGARMAVELHQRECPVGDSDESLPVALRQFRLMESFLHRFLALGKLADGPRSVGSANELVQDVCELLRPMAQHLGVQLNIAEPAERLMFDGDRESLGELLSNLIVNACEAATEVADRPPQVIITLAAGLRAGRGLIRVCDTGPGPPCSVREQLFEPFVTGKPSGMGLGLFVARQIAEAHGASLSWERRGDMTCFSLEFPTGGDYGSSVDRG
jgi:signal transduction histidine kinase